MFTEEAHGTDRRVIVVPMFTEEAHGTDVESL